MLVSSYRFKDTQCVLQPLCALYTVVKLGRASNASANVKVLRSMFPLNITFPKLAFFKKNYAGRNITGSITLFSKGSKVKTRHIPIAYQFRYSTIFFIASFNYVPLTATITSLVFTSLVLVCYLPARTSDTLFTLNRLRSLKRSAAPGYREVLHFKPFIAINTIPFMLIQQQKNAPVSYLELVPLLGSTYARSLGCKAFIIKLDSRTGFSLVRLPSGIKKIFSAFSLAHTGPAGYAILKKQLRNTRAGFWQARGSKSTVRGVAMNPIDHPHGGRTKAIKYPRTPWGKTTKFK